MKKTLKVLALIIAAGFPCVAFAEFIGASSITSLPAESALFAFISAVGALILWRDYSSALPSLVVEERAGKTSSRRSQAYGIRRPANGARVVG